MANPSNVFALDDLRSVIGREIITVVCSPGQVAEYISRLYRHDQETDQAAKSAAAAQTAASESTQVTVLTDLAAAVEDAPIVKYVNLILRQALNERASDIHIEPTPDDLRIRFRIDGVLHDVTRSPKAIQGGVTTRLKVMASLDIAEHRIPQDGRISLNAGNREIDLRVSTLPTVHGEKVVMRVLDKSNVMLNLGDLGFLPDVLKRYEVAYRKPYGTILVTGPTGSGKSTTLYATCNILNRPERNLITVEDPVEYQLRGINQVQVNPKAGLTFASALRSILRSDPDVILVGEIRDRETAIIAIEAALTGHVVLSSLHTNDAAGTPMRLVEMGVEPFLVGSALDCVVAQRLARLLCDNCSETHKPTDAELETFGWNETYSPERGPRFRKAVGCQACSRTGYKGRLALHEILLVNEEIERMIIARASAEEIQKVAMEQGMLPLRTDGLRKAALGLTSLEEVLRVVV
jgi:type IV pilus assembly protein PilB